MSAIKNPRQVTIVQETAPMDDGMMDMQANSTICSTLKGVTYDPNTTANLGPQGWVDLLNKNEDKK
jgi:hypothetical protein